MTVKELKKILGRTLDLLEDYDDDDKVKMVSNTYFLGECRAFLGVSGYDGGYVNLDDPVDDEEDDEDELEYEDTFDTDLDEKE